MQTARPWLPQACIADGALARALQRLTEAWSTRWLPDGKGVSVQAAPVQSRTKVRSELHAWASGGVLFTTDPAHLVRLAQVMLDLKPPRGVQLKADDIRMLRGIGSTAAGDLAEAAFALFQTSGAALPAPSREREVENGVRFAIALAGGGAAFDVYVDANAATAGRKALIQQSRGPEALARLDDALASQRVRVGACLGESRMNLADLRGLALGDVVIIDRGPASALDLAINGRATALACSLLSDGAPRLKISASTETGGAA